MRCRLPFSLLFIILTLLVLVPQQAMTIPGFFGIFHASIGGVGTVGDIALTGILLRVMVAIT